MGVRFCGKSFDFVCGCNYFVYGCDFDYNCYYECRDGSDLFIYEYLYSRVFDGVVFLLEYFYNLVLGVVSI